MCNNMSDKPKSPLLNIAASIAATVKCCVSSDTITTNTITDNAINGDPSQTNVSTLTKSTSTMSTDLTPIVEEEPRVPAPAQPQA